MRRQICGVEDVLETDRQATKRRLGELRIVSGAPRCFEIEHDKSADIILACIDGLRAGVDRGAQLVRGPDSRRRTRSSVDNIAFS